VFVDDMRSDECEGVPDGMKCDERGNVYVTGPGGVWILAPDGSFLGMVDVPELVANLNWGGDQWSELYLTSTTSLYRIRLRVGGNRVSYMHDTHEDRLA
jgi:gluconolactonase